MFLLALLVALNQRPVVVPGPASATPIADALALAAPGDTVRIAAGIYREPTIVVHRPVTLIGAPGAVLDGEGQHVILRVRADDVTIRGFTFRNTGFSYSEDRAALEVSDAQRCHIVGNRVENAFFGIYLAQVTDCLVDSNRVVGAGRRDEVGTGSGIHLWSSRNVTVLGNQISGQRDGIYMEFSHHTTVRENLSTRNTRYGLHFMYSDSSAYVGNTFESNGSGVAVMYTREVLMQGNRFANAKGANAYGLLLKDIKNAQLTGNTFQGNTTALLADGADGITARDNRFEDNGWALRLLGSTAVGRFEGNAFRGNSFDVVVNGDGGQVSFDGNWWQDYRGWDLDHDGVGDVVHHPVRLFAVLVEHSQATMLLQRSLFVRLLDAAERALPVLTPAGVVDHRPLMHDPTGAKP